MKRCIFFTVLSFLLGYDCLAKIPEPPCILNPAQMPENWRPPAELQKVLNPAAWSEGEAKDAEYAIRTALDEMIEYFERKPSAVQNLWDDSIEALIQVTYGSANKPEFDDKVRDAARKNLTALIKPYLELDPNGALCKEFDELLPLAIFTHRLFGANDTRTEVVTKRTNAAFRHCGSLDAAITIDYQDILANKDAPPDDIEDLFDLYLWSLWFIEAELYPNIELPAEARKFGEQVWKYFETFRLTGASQYKNGSRDEKFIKVADLATHIAHIPTGTHRFPLYVEDSPALYHFHRENFYGVMQSGDLDLFASVMDTLRQYGCTAENDVQVRDGSRYLLRVFHDHNDRWMNYRSEDEADEDLDDYDLIHHPWTAVLGLRQRIPEEPKPGTYGGIVRRWLPHPRQGK